MKRVILSWLVFLSTGLQAWLHAGVKIDVSSYRESPDFRVAREGDTLIVNWSGENKGSIRLRLNPADPERLIAELSLAPTPSSDRKVRLKDATRERF